MINLAFLLVSVSRAAKRISTAWETHRSLCTDQIFPEQPANFDRFGNISPRGDQIKPLEKWVKSKRT
jgi:hypothetical protein